MLGQHPSLHLEPSCPHLLSLVERTTVGTHKQREREAREAVGPTKQTLCFWPLLEGKGCLSTLTKAPREHLFKVTKLSRLPGVKLSQTLQGWSKGGHLYPR